jgi:DNA-binding CsgD family transcriptional regulator/tetratricopeptide (TPR) repeat protein
MNGGTLAMPRPLVERERELTELARAIREAQDGIGSVVLVEGEAGIGKSSIVQAIRSVLPPEGRLLLGLCDDLATPRVLGPLRDLRHQVGTALSAALDGADRGRVPDALRAELDWAGHPTVLAIEDVHWADEATLDVLRYLVQRMPDLPAVLVLTYRDQCSADHPLRHLLGQVARATRVRRLRPAHLSINGVRRLGERSSLSAEAVFALTSGNPFLVVEVLTSGDLGQVPPGIAEAVVARLSGLDGASRQAVELLSVIPSAVERWLVEAVVPGGLASLGPAEVSGVLNVLPTRVAFRHELTRRAIADSLAASRRVQANQAVLAALLDRRTAADVDLSRILHHAAEAGDEAAIIRYGPLAQDEAASAGAHREAVAHGRLTLRHRDAFAPGVLAKILERHAIECYTIGDAGEALANQLDAVTLRRGLGDARDLGVSLRWLSRLRWWCGDRARAEECAREAIETLACTDDDAALAFALSNQAQLDGLAGRLDEAIAVGERAVSMARRLADPSLLSHALNNIGHAHWEAGRTDQARAVTEEALAIALAANEIEHASRAYVHLAWHAIDDLRLDDAAATIEDGIAVAEGAEFLGFRAYLMAMRARLHLGRAQWGSAERDAGEAAGSRLVVRCLALTVSGRAAARQGDSIGESRLEEAFTIAERLREAQRLGPAGSALVEAGWLRGDPDPAARRVLPWYEEVLRYGYPPVAAELGYWLRLAGHEVPVPDTAHPYAWLTYGEWRRAATVWREAGMPYEHALALSASDSPDDLLAALSILDGIRAEPLVRTVRSALRDLGVARIPRGPTPPTRDNPAGLTERQAQVLRLLGQGLTNAEIAASLVVSVRTVDTHVTAILTKLGVPSRRDAARRATVLGLAGPGIRR